MVDACIPKVASTFPKVSHGETLGLVSSRGKIPKGRGRGLEVEDKFLDFSLPSFGKQFGLEMRMVVVLHIFWQFHPYLLGEDEPILTFAYFSDGLVQPPTRMEITW